MRKLHIGGKESAEGWEIFDIQPADYVDHVGDASDLSQFSDGSFAEVYTSHTVEHLDYKRELILTLKECFRVLEPNGKFYISVPDMDVLARLFLDKKRLTLEERFVVMRSIFGGHEDEYDYHHAGLNREFLNAYLIEAGFDSIEKVEEFGLFNDSSSKRFKEELISLNIIATKPAIGKYKNIGRKDPCPCKSGKKFKHCHGKIA